MLRAPPRTLYLPPMAWRTPNLKDRIFKSVFWTLSFLSGSLWMPAEVFSTACSNNSQPQLLKSNAYTFWQATIASWLWYFSAYTTIVTACDVPHGLYKLNSSARLSFDLDSWSPYSNICRMSAPHKYLLGSHWWWVVIFWSGLKVQRACTCESPSVCSNLQQYNCSNTIISTSQPFSVSEFMIIISTIIYDHKLSLSIWSHWLLQASIQPVSQRLVLICSVLIAPNVNPFHRLSWWPLLKTIALSVSCPL